VNSGSAGSVSSNLNVPDSRTRALLDRYALSSRVLSHDAGDRMAREAGQSVEFHDFRQYQPGDELRHVDWRAYARTGRLYTKLHQAERTIRLHLLLDTSGSMQLFGKLEFMKRLGQLLIYVAQRDSRSQVHSFSGRHSRPALGVRAIADAWDFIASLSGTGNGAAGLLPVEAIRNFALQVPPGQGASLLLIISDLLDPAPLRPALAALRARGFDATFLQVMAPEDLEPDEALLELQDSETDLKLQAGPAEVRAYRSAVRAFNERTRAAILQAGYRHQPFTVPPASGADLEQQALASLLRSGIIHKR
jgi:uncharacterized protein (DUF58 family)